MPQRIGRAFAYALLIWIIGFIWGSVVFMTPALKNIPSIPFVSRYPAISFPLLLVSIIITYVLARSYLKQTSAGANEGLRLGILFAVVNCILDLLVLVLLFKNGFGYFASLTVLLYYLILIIVPWYAGRQQQT